MPASSFHEELALTTSPDDSWAVLTDVPRLVDWVSIVGEAKELVPLEKYTAVLADRLGPFRLRAELDVQVSEVEVARHIRVRAHGEDRQVASRISVDATMSLSPHSGDGTLLSVAGSYEVSGRVATMGTGVIRKKADTILREFFDQAATELASR